MKLNKTFFMISLLLLFLPVVAGAGDFDWTRDFNARAGADPAVFRARLAARFNMGDLQVNAMLANVVRPAVAYIVLCLGEMSGKPTDSIIGHVKAGKGRGWGLIAKNLGIKPGSPEFHALKEGSDLYNDRGKGEGNQKGARGVDRVAGGLQSV